LLKESESKIKVQVKASYHKLKLAGWVVSLKSIPTVTAIVAPGANDAARQTENHSHFYFTLKSVLLFPNKQPCIP